MGDAPEPVTGHLHPAVHAHAEGPVWSYAAELIRLPAFADALPVYCAAMMQPPEIAWPADKFFGQKLRYLVSFALIGQDARWRRGAGEPPTLSALQRAAHASPRQVAALVAALKLGGYVVATRPSQDRRTVRLRPAMPLLAEIGRSPLAFLAASEQVVPPPRPLASRLRREDIALADWLGRSYDMFMQEDVYFGCFSNIVRFTEQDCGYPILSAVLSAHYAARAGAVAPITLSYGGLAERFRVSRQHVGNILSEAERRGCFSVDHGGRAVAVAPDFLLEFETWAAGQMAHYRLLAEQVELESKRPVPK